MENWAQKGADLYQELVRSVTTTEPVEPEDEEEAEKIFEDDYQKSPGRNPSLKIFFVRSNIQPDEISNILFNNIYKNKYIEQFLNKYQIVTTQKENDYWLLTLKWMKYGKDINYLIKVRGKTWEVITNEKMEFIKPSFVKMLGFCNEMGEMWLERSELEEVVNEIINRESISGFIAKRETITSPKKVTIRVYGGTREDLDLARKDFKSEPTRIYFSRRNSPEAAVVGSLQADPGCLSIDRIIPSALGLFENIHDDIGNKFNESYEDRFIQTVLTESDYSENEDGSFVQMNRQFRALIMKFKDKWESEELRNSIKYLLLDGYKNKKSQYLGYECGNDCSFIIHDTEIGGMIQLRIDERRYEIILNSLTPGKPILMDNLAKTISEKIDHAVVLQNV